MFKSSKEKLLAIRKDLPEDDFALEHLYGDFISLILHSFIWILVLAIIETKLLKINIGIYFRCCSKKNRQ
jgi:hypothetical protein